MTKYCPHCKEGVSKLDYKANFTEQNYGISWGYYDLEDEDTYNEGQDTNGSDMFEEDEFEYSCPECNGEVEADELLNENDLAELLADEEEDKPMTIKEKLDAFNKLNQQKV